MNKVIKSTQLGELGLLALEHAAKKAFEEHARSKDPVIMFESGMVKAVDPQQFMDQEQGNQPSEITRKAS